MGKTDRRAKLAELKALRQAGKKAFDNYQVDDINELYEEVDETQYKKIVRDRLNEDDFVVDDNGEGYADDGREEWDRVQQYHYASDSEEDGSGARGRPTKASKKKQADDAARREANDRDISTYFTSGAGKTQAKPKVAKTKEDDDFLADLLGEVDTNVPAPVPRSTKRHRSPDRQQRRVRVASSPPHERSQPLAKRSKIQDDRPSSPPAADDMLMDDNFVPTMDDDELPTQFPMSDPAPSSPAAKVAERKAQIKKEPDDDDDDMMEVAHAGTVTAASVNIAGSRPPKKLIKPEPYPAPITSSPVKQESAIDPSAWNDITNNLNIVSSSVSEVKSIRKIDYKDAIEENGSLNMFWTDYTEVSGSLCLFGKVLNKKTGQHVSCFVKIDNILRKLFFLPRETRVQGGIDTCDEVGMMDVYSEVDALMTKMKIGKYKIKPCNRKYAFELPDIPKEGQYLKCLYPYNTAPLDAGETGETFSHVFGTNTALFEQFVLWKNIMGPCWLNIKDADFSSLQNASHCKLEVLVEHPNMVAPLRDSENLETPPLTLMSLAMRTTFNAKDNKLEILALSARVYEKVSLSDTTPAEKLPCRTFTLVRPNGSAFPGGFEKLAKDRSSKGLIKTFKHESEILMFFLAQLDIVDPDVILGHQLEGVDYSVLLNRIHEKKTPQWSRK
ncbi:DNA polymerase alpha catalytic subunit like protein [Verticillium longisporum]|nr:DNA polymerase alpha catalytic subunit like protein [Verticillium longisporum]